MKIIHFKNFDLYLGDPPTQFISDEDRARWCEALRSGRYAQGRALLRDFFDNYCCLGVQCELENMPWTQALTEPGWESGNSFNFYNGRLPIGHRGMFPVGTFVQGHGLIVQYKSLTVCNDVGMTFSEIADIIDTIWNPKSYEPTI